MPHWAIALLSAAAASVLTTLFREVVACLRQPKLKLDFEECDGRKPYVLDQFWGLRIAGKTSKVKFLRLNVRNDGRKPALNCEAKMVVLKAEKKEPLKPLIHWSRRDPAVYKTLDQIYAPIHLNKRDEETLDLLIPPYYPEDQGIGPGATIQTLSPKEYHFQRNVNYQIEVTVYASNTISKMFALKLCWDGTLEGFDKAVEKAEGSTNVQNL